MFTQIKIASIVVTDTMRGLFELGFLGLVRLGLDLFTR
jgi:hypothetical protein